MAREAVNRGLQADDNTGDPLREAFGKINNTTLELYNALGDGTDLTINDIVTSTEGVANNNNNTSLPTTAAVKAYVDNNEANTTYSIGTADGSSSDREKITLVDSASTTYFIELIAGTGLSISRTNSTITLNNTVTDTDQNTTYSISCADGDQSDEEKIVLTDSGSGTDEIVLEAGTGLSIARSGDKITFTNTVADSDTNTTYTISAVDSGADAIIRLTDSSSTPVTDDVKLVAGTNITITPTGDDIEIATSAVDGSGTENKLSKWSDTDTLTDSIVSESGEVLDIDANGAIVIPIGTDAERDALTAESGMLRFNTTDNEFEGYNGTEWGAIGGSGGGGGQVTVQKNTITATAGQVNFTIDSEPASVNNLQVYLDGVYQAKSNYTFSGTTVSINSNTGVAAGVEVEIIHLKVVNARVELNSHTGDGSDRTFSTSSTITSENDVQVYIDGVYQSKDTYSISGTTVTFDEGNAPPNGTAVELLHIVATSAESALANYNVSVISADTNAQKDYLYVLTATLTLTLPSSPGTGDSIKISNRSGVDTATVARNGKKIMGAAEDLTLDKLNTGFEMIFSGDAQGWILIGVEGTSA